MEEIRISQRKVGKMIKKQETLLLKENATYLFENLLFTQAVIMKFADHIKGDLHFNSCTFLGAENHFYALNIVFENCTFVTRFQEKADHKKIMMRARSLSFIHNHIECEEPLSLYLKGTDTLTIEGNRFFGNEINMFLPILNPLVIHRKLTLSNQFVCSKMLLSDNMGTSMEFLSENTILKHPDNPFTVENYNPFPTAETHGYQKKLSK